MKSLAVMAFSICSITIRLGKGYSTWRSVLMKSLAVMAFSKRSITIRLDRVQYLESCIDEVSGSDGLLHMLHHYQAGQGTVPGELC